MHSVFETAPAASAIPIVFATKATWDAVLDELPAPARQFARANDFTAKPGRCLILPTADGRIAQVMPADNIAATTTAKRDSGTSEMVILFNVTATPAPQSVLCPARLFQR